MDRYELQHAIYRGLWHFIGSAIIAIAAMFLPKSIVIIYLSSVAAFFLSFEFLRFKSVKLNDWFLKNFRFMVVKKEKSSIVGSTYILLSSIFVITIFPRELAVLAVLFLSIGDPTATIVGRLWGRTKLSGGKTLQGSLACLISCLIIGFVIQAAAQMSLTVLLVIGGSLAATLSESFSFKVNDNLAMPIGSATVMWLLQSLGA